MKTILILSNHHLYTYNLRKELIQELIDSGYRVIIALPYGEKVELLKKMGCEFVNISLDRRGTNPISDLKLLKTYVDIIKKKKPDIVLTYTLKPNLYGGIACRINKISNVLHTVTGLGTVFVREVWYKKIIIKINKYAFKSAKTIAFMNHDNKKLYEELSIASSNHNRIVVPGSGVNLDYFKYVDYPTDQVHIKFTFIARILQDKGIEEFLYAAKNIKGKFQHIIFEVVGFVDEFKYEKLLNDYQEEGIIKYLGKQSDMPKVMGESHCIVLPSYGEGRGTVLQEAAAVGRPLITTNTYGCRDNVEDNLNGYLCNVKDGKSLENAFDKFLQLTHIEKSIMGKKSREKAEREFDRKLVVEIYKNEIIKM